LRSGAFAPDVPFVIFVRLRLPSDSLGRIDGARLPGDHDAVLRGSLVCGATRPVVREGDLRGRLVAAARTAATRHWAGGASWRWSLARWWRLAC